MAKLTTKKLVKYLTQCISNAGMDTALQRTSAEMHSDDGVEHAVNAVLKYASNLVASGPTSDKRT